MFSLLRKETNPDGDKGRKSYGPSASLFIFLKPKGRYVFSWGGGGGGEGWGLRVEGHQ